MGLICFIVMAAVAVVENKIRTIISIAFSLFCLLFDL
jgi:hypothetical protein